MPGAYESSRAVIKAEAGEIIKEAYEAGRKSGLSDAWSQAERVLGESPSKDTIAAVMKYRNKINLIICTDIMNEQGKT